MVCHFETKIKFYLEGKDNPLTFRSLGSEMLDSITFLKPVFCGGSAHLPHCLIFKHSIHSQVSIPHCWVDWEKFTTSHEYKTSIPN